tara:strand:+ start:751 stop:1476 length:726 start_codon:yes stop_codon:yes gene_type:complete
MNTIDDILKGGIIKMPDSYIKKNEEIKAVRELEEPLNRDVVDHVLKFVKPYISLNDMSEEDHVKYWYKLGRETNNLRMWRYACTKIMEKSFGISHENNKELKKMSFQSFKGYLEDYMVKNLKNWDEIKTYEKVGKKDYADMFYGGNNDDFYENVSGYMIFKRPYRKFITLKEKWFMLRFIERLNEYLDYVDDNILQNKDILHIGKYSKTDLTRSIKRLRHNNKKFLVTVQNITIGIDKREP